MKLRRAFAILLVGGIAVMGFEPSAASFSRVTSNPGDAFSSALDWTAPTVSLNDPGANLRGTVTLAATASDADSAVASVKIQRSPAGAGTWSDVCTDASSPYSCSFDTTTVADGLYDLRAVATDNAGNTRTSSTVANRRVDNTVPTAVVTDPGPYLRGTTALGATSTDAGSGVASVKIERAPANGSTWTDVCTDASSPYSCSFDTTTVADGLYDLRAVATDNAGNVTTSTLVEDRRVDNTPPTATMADPGQYLRGTIALGATSTDAGSGTASVKIQRSPTGAGTWSDVCTDASSPYSCSFDTTAVADGLYDLRVIATDHAGNTQTSSTVANRRVDNTVPTAVMTDPGPYLRGTTTVDATSTDAGSGVASVKIEQSVANASSWTEVCTDTTAPYTCPADTTLAPDGLYDLRAIATDNAGNTTTSTVVEDRRVDNTRPTATAISSTNGGVESGVIHQNDTISYTFSEAMAPSSVLGGWNGSSQNVRLRLVDSGNSDQVVIQTTGGGTVSLGTVTTNRNYTTSTQNLNAHMELVSNGTEVRVTLDQGVSSPPGRQGTANMSWASPTSPTDLAGNAATGNTRAETDGDRDF